MYTQYVFTSFLFFNLYLFFGHYCPRINLHFACIDKVTSEKYRQIKQIKPSQCFYFYPFCEKNHIFQSLAPCNFNLNLNNPQDLFYNFEWRTLKKLDIHSSVEVSF